MWVPASQKPMQAAMPSPPPPGRLGADSLGLAPVDEPPPGKVAVVPPALGTVTVPPPGVVTVVPPLPRNVDVVGGTSGGTDGTRGAGVPTADGSCRPGAAALGDALTAGDGVRGVTGADRPGESEPPGRPIVDEGDPLAPAPMLEPVPEPVLALPPVLPVCATASGDQTGEETGNPTGNMRKPAAPVAATCRRSLIGAWIMGTSASGSAL